MVAGTVLTGMLAGCGGGGQRAGQSQGDSAAASSSPAGPDGRGPDESPSHNPAGTSRPPGTAPVAAGEDQCASPDLQLSVGGGDAAAGTTYRSLRFTNVSGRPCTVQGFPGISYVTGDDGRQVGAPAERVGGRGDPIRLAGGETASADVGFVNVHNYDAATCRPQAVRGLRVYPPGETAAKFVRLEGTGCANDKVGQLNVKALRPGRGQ